MDALPGPGYDPGDDAIQGRVAGSAPTPFVPMPWGEVLAPVVKATARAIFTNIVGAFIVTLLVMFFGDVILRLGIGFVDCLQWSYIALLGLTVFVQAFAMAYMGWRAARQHTPYRLMYEAVVKCKLHSDPDTKYRHRRMTRTELEALVMHRRNAQLLAAAVFGALLSGGLFGRLGRRTGSRSPF